MSLLPIYNSKGEAQVFLEYPYIFNLNGDWVGYVGPTREVYSVLGYYVGALTNDPRIVRKRATSTLMPRIPPPSPPTERRYPPATFPLAPLMSELSNATIDVLLEEPDRLHPLDMGELREDLD